VPELKQTPGTADGTVRSSVRTEYAATSSGVAASGHDVPGVDIIGFRRHPSRNTPFSASARKTST